MKREILMKNKKAIVCLSFDDGRKDFFDNAFPILKKYNLTASLNVTTGYVDGSFKPAWATSDMACTKKQLLEMKDYGIEIAYHGDQHITSEDDFEKSRNKFIEWNLDEQHMGFAVPGSYLDEVNLDQFIKYLKKINVDYMRIDSKKKNTFFCRVYRKLYNITGFSIFYLLFNRYNMFNVDSLDDYNIPSVVVFEKDNFRNLIRLIKIAIKRKKVIVFMLHGILDEDDKNYGKDEYAWSSKNFENFCKKLTELKENNKVEILNLIDVINEKNK